MIKDSHRHTISYILSLPRLSLIPPSTFAGSKKKWKWNWFSVEKSIHISGWSTSTKHYPYCNIVIIEIAIYLHMSDRGNNIFLLYLLLSYAS